MEVLLYIHTAGYNFKDMKNDKGWQTHGDTAALTRLVKI